MPQSFQKVGFYKRTKQGRKRGDFTMRRFMCLAVAVFVLVLSASACSFVTSATGGNTGMSNDVWFAEGTGLNQMFVWSSKVYYCPPMAGGAATCTEAKMLEEGGTSGGGGQAPANDASGGAKETGAEEDL
ncbi:MAG: hypothetical protein V1754_16065 [Pseudomonadota bacterium]